jgi:subtilisin family serine protease
MIDRFLTTPLPPPVQPVVLVAAAGNEGALGYHSAGSVPPGGVVKRLRFELHSEKKTSLNAITRVTIRFTAPHGLGCRLVPPGDNTSGGSNLAPPDGAASFAEATQNSTCSINGSLVLGGAPGSRQVDIEVTSTATGTNQPGVWVIELTNAGAAAIPYHAWIEGHQCDALLDDLSRANTISSPGSAAGIITVGNYASSGKDKGKLDDASSRGPRVDGLQKPDISAPGEKICSAKRDLHMGCCCDCCCSSYVDMSGTSMAAPHVTGAIALMLNRNPALTHQQIKNILIANARRDSFTGTTANNDFGAGKLDVLALLNDPLVRQGGAVLLGGGGAALARTRPDDVAAAAARALPELPQLEEGTPLWRLLNTAEGKRLYRLGRRHWEEARALVNSRKRVATVWHRNHGPFVLHHVTRTTLLPHVPLPREVDGVEVAIRAARLVSALEPYASKALIEAMHATLPLVSRLQGKTLLELVAMFESTEPQHA